MLDVLCNRNDKFPQRVCDARFIHHIWIPPGKIHDYNSRLQNQQENVLHNHGSISNIVSAKTPPARVLTCAFDRSVDPVKSSLKWHHDGNQIIFDLELRHVENSR